MSFTLYPRLAVDGIRKNSRLYTPYILTCMGMVMLFYIIHYLAAMGELDYMPGGTTTAQMLGFGVWIVALFAFIFLTFTNSFLMRRRNKEFGLYNMLGMSKMNLSIVMLFETVIVFAVSVLGGLFGGILLSKLAELGLTRALKGKPNYDFFISGDAVEDVFRIFVPIFCFILAKSIYHVHKMSAVSLIKSENMGEKPPKANYLLAVFGVAILAVAYYMAASIQNPIMALSWFFVAVGMVIIATYLLFVSGSVALCRVLQKSKSYYYKKSHFISVSSMTYRMKRNGASLASICVLSTMVLVMLLGSGSLFFGSNDMINKLYPNDLNIRLYYYEAEDNTDTRYTPQKVEYAVNHVHQWLSERNLEPKNEQYCMTIGCMAIIDGDSMTLDYESVSYERLIYTNKLADVYFISLDEYKRFIDPDASLEEDEVLLYSRRTSYDYDTITLSDSGYTWRIKEKTKKMFPFGESSTSVQPYFYIVVSDLMRTNDIIQAELGDNAFTDIYLRWGFDVDLSNEAEVDLFSDFEFELYEIEKLDETKCHYSYCTCRALEYDDMFGMSAGVFFLGVFLSVVFLMATTLIIYYKQITEGYEDESRFAIMRKVGMTKRDIRKSINSQMLTVFFLPLAMAALHTCFAFPMVQKLLALFNLQNESLSLTVMGVTILVFGVIYALIYKATSNTYYSIVSGGKDD